MAPSAFVAAAPPASAPSSRTARCSAASPYGSDPKAAKSISPAHLASRAAERARLIADDAAAKKAAWEAELAALRDPPAHSTPAVQQPSYAERWQRVASASTSYASRIAIEEFIAGSPMSPAKANGVAPVASVVQEPPTPPPAVKPVAVAAPPTAAQAAKPVAVAAPPTPTPVASPVPKSKVGSMLTSKDTELTPQKSPSNSSGTRAPPSTATKSVSAPPSKAKSTPLKAASAATQSGSLAPQATATKSAPPSTSTAATKKSPPPTPSAKSVATGSQAPSDTLTYLDTLSSAPKVKSQAAKKQSPESPTLESAPSEKSPSPVQSKSQEVSTPNSENGLKSFSAGLLDAIVEGVSPKPTTNKKKPAASASAGEVTVPANVLDAVNEGKLSALTVTKLRRMLSDCGLKTAGRKSELIARLTSFVRK